MWKTEMKIIEIKNSPEAMLKSLDELRKDIESGEVTCYAAIGILRDDGTCIYTGSVGGKTALQLRGAVAQLFQRFDDWVSNINE